METNKLATHAIQEPIHGAFILKKVFLFIDDHTLKECIKQLGDDDKIDLVYIMQDLGFKEVEIESILK